MIGVLITNLGTPDAPTSSAVRHYLAEFLSDRRVVDLPRVLWWLILHGVILRTRPTKVAKLYKKIWTDSGSPLLKISEQQRQLLEDSLSNNDKIQVEVGMRYGSPSINSALLKLKTAEKIIVLPLFPQYSSATTASTFDAVFNSVQQWQHIPELQLISDYHDNSDYIDALAKSIQTHRNKHNSKKLLISFHGLPKRYVELGDPYSVQCQHTANLLAQKLKLNSDQWQIMYQSRFGKEEWLTPYADELIVELAESGIDSIDVVCPGFAVDCLETLEEINQQYRELFIAHGGKEFNYIPALNDSTEHIDVMRNIVLSQL